MYCARRPGAYATLTSEPPSGDSPDDTLWVKPWHMQLILRKHVVCFDSNAVRGPVGWVSQIDDSTIAFDFARWYKT